MKPRIESISELKLIGQSMNMTLEQDRTIDLFKQFMPRRSLITNSINSDIYEVLIYEDSNFKNFTPQSFFTKWVCLAVDHFEDHPSDMNPLTIEQGLYAIFTYKGHSSSFGKFMHWILTEWLAQSPYHLDARPHFHILGDKYKHGHPESEEEVYIPVKILE